MHAVPQVVEDSRPFPPAPHDTPHYLDGAFLDLPAPPPMASGPGPGPGPGPGLGPEEYYHTGMHTVLLSELETPGIQ